MTRMGASWGVRTTSLSLEGSVPPKDDLRAASGCRRLGAGPASQTGSFVADSPPSPVLCAGEVHRISTGASVLPTSPTTLVVRPSRELTPLERESQTYAGQGSRMDDDGDVADEFFEVQESGMPACVNTILERSAARVAQTTVVPYLNTICEIRYLVPDPDGGWHREVLVAVPKKEGTLVMPDTWFHFPKPRPGTDEVEVLADRMHIVRNSTGEGLGECQKFVFDPPASGDLFGTRSLLTHVHSRLCVRVRALSRSPFTLV